MPTDDNPAQEPLAKLLWRAHHWFRLAVTSGLEDEPGGVSPAHASLLSQLDPDGMPMADLARLLGVSTPAVHQMVHRLVTLGLLEVVPNPRSGRSKLVVLTPDGRARRKQALDLVAELEAELGQRIGRRRVAALRDALEQDWGAADIDGRQDADGGGDGGDSGGSGSRSGRRGGRGSGGGRGSDSSGGESSGGSPGRAAGE